MKRNVIEYLRETVLKQPEKVALVDENRKVTFKELNDEAQKVASIITKRLGYKKNQPIAVYMDKSVECIIAFLGIIYSGNFYCPLDSKAPMERINRIISTLNPAAVICKERFENKLNFSNVVIAWNEVQEKEIDFRSIELYKAVLDVDPVYVLFTSGSTGQPKGVTICHKGVIDYTEWLHKTFGFCENTVFGEQAPFYFDNSILDIYSTIKNGSTLIIIPEKLFVFPKLLLEFINTHDINTLFWVPSALIGVANSEALDIVYLNKLEKVLFCGEVMPNKQLNIWRKHYPNIQYANLYGPTEITDVCSYYIVDREFADEEELPIGRACENMEILVLNEQGQLVGKEEIGELCVRGSGLAMGYYGNIEKTENSFVQNPLNPYYRDTIYRTGDLVRYNEYGELIYVCRKDFQIKHQGHRIELGEIEIIAASIEGVAQSCAIYDDKKKKIILFCTLFGELQEKQIYKSLSDKLPKYMLPAYIRILDKMPLNLNGKIDRVQLGRLIKEK